MDYGQACEYTPDGKLAQVSNWLISEMYRVLPSFTEFYRVSCHPLLLSYMRRSGMAIARKPTNRLFLKQ